ncbi:MAG: pyridoxamine 5'-phosphate oxidase family protein [Blastochloris sp.]|nr:pyridoxamine 5'-phosphate oxidase family protein [Blastochloris sp.]
MQIQNLSEIEAAFIERVHRMVWCSVATIDTQGRPRSRILHPIWEGATGWILTGRQTLKAKHIVCEPDHISLAYIHDVMRPVYIDCRAEWIDEVAQKQRIWTLFASTPEPLGYDPATTFPGVDHPATGLLKLTPWRIDLVSFPAPSYEEGTKVWRQKV